MVSKAKLYAQLDRLEDELSERLVPHLRRAAEGENDFVFCTTDFSQSSREPRSIDVETDALIQLGRQILALREKLNEPCEGIIAARICWYCNQWSGVKRGDPGATAVLAKQFLEEIDATTL